MELLKAGVTQIKRVFSERIVKSMDMSALNLL